MLSMLSTILPTHLRSSKRDFPGFVLSRAAKQSTEELGMLWHMACQFEYNPERLCLPPWRGSFALGRSWLQLPCVVLGLGLFARHNKAIMLLHDPGSFECLFRYI
jgi:hypothetical protein